MVVFLSWVRVVDSGSRPRRTAALRRRRGVRRAWERRWSWCAGSGWRRGRRLARADADAEGDGDAEEGGVEEHDLHRADRGSQGAGDDEGEAADEHRGGTFLGRRLGWPTAATRRSGSFYPRARRDSDDGGAARGLTDEGAHAEVGHHVRIDFSAPVRPVQPVQLHSLNVRGQHGKGRPGRTPAPRRSSRGTKRAPAALALDALDESGNILKLQSNPLVAWRVRGWTGPTGRVVLRVTVRRAP